MQVEFTDFAKAELQKIYNYYVEVASEKTALRIIEKITDETEKLERLPSIGSKEILLGELKKRHRYLICGNYKIIFYKAEETIFVTDIFDCRKNPEKIIERNK